MPQIAPLPGRKVTDFPLLTRHLVNTNGTASQAAGNTIYLDPILSFGSSIEDLVVHARTHSISDAVTRWVIVAEWSIDLEAWTEFAVALMGTQSAVGQNNQTAHSTRTDYGLYIRFKVVAWDSSTTAQQSAVISATVSVKVYT